MQFSATNLTELEDAVSIRSGHEYCYGKEMLSGFDRTRALESGAMSVAESRESGADNDKANLLGRALHGSNSALGQLLQGYRDYLLLMADEELGSDLKVKASASDLVQESFLEAQRDFGQFAGVTSAEFQSWLKRVLLNNIWGVGRDYRGTGKRDISRETEILDRNQHSANSFAGDDPSASSVAMKNELLNAVQSATRKLPRHYQEVIHWRNYERESFEKIGQRLQRSAEAVRKLWVRALEMLQQELESPNDPSTCGSREPI